MLNKIHLGDCRDILKQIGEKSVDIVISDIPYGIDFDDWDILHNNKNSALGGASNHQKENTSFRRRGKPLNGWSTEDRQIPYEYQKWCQGWARELYRVTKEGSPILLFSSRRLQHRVSAALEDEGFIIRDVLIWKKDKCHTKAQRISKVLERRGIEELSDYVDYRIGNMKPIYEPIIWAMKPYKGTLTDCILENKIGGFYCKEGEVPSIIIDYPCNKRNEHHPTEKPIGLIEELLERFSISKEHIILDPFIGSGTTAIACINKGRNYIGIELNESYYDIASARIRCR